MSNEQAQELNDLAETVATYYKALMYRAVPQEIAGELVRDWQRAYIQDEIDRRARGRRYNPPVVRVPPETML